MCFVSRIIQYVQVPYNTYCLLYDKYSNPIETSDSDRFHAYCIISYDTDNHASMFEVMFSCVTYGILMNLIVLKKLEKTL